MEGHIYVNQTWDSLTTSIISAARFVHEHIVALDDKDPGPHSMSAIHKAENTVIEPPMTDKMAWHLLRCPEAAALIRDKFVVI